MTVREFMNVVEGNVAICTDGIPSHTFNISSYSYTHDIFSDELLNAEVTRIRPSSSATIIVDIDFRPKKVSGCVH